MTPKILNEKRYIGDGVFVTYNSPGIRLATENGLCETNIIVLEPEVLYELERFIEQVRESLK
jgi:hypothetical protein